MLTKVADGVLVHESVFCQSNTVVVVGESGVLVIDAGVHESEISCLVNDLSELGHAVVAGFSTHPHWDHLLWHESLGTAPRFATTTAATTARERLAGGIDAKRFGIPEEVSLELVGDVSGLPVGTTLIPWDGPAIRIMEHRAHAPGHAALLIESCGVLVAGDMVSDALIPMLDLNATTDPFEDYLDGLRLLDDVAGGVDVVIPGHGSVGGAEQLRSRIAADRAYVTALRDGRAPDDVRIGPAATAGWEWVGDVHTGQAQRIAARNAE